MNQHARTARPNGRTSLIRRPLALFATALLLAGAALPASAADWWTATPQLSIGTTTINARDKGALGDGVHDDTAALQAAVNALPRDTGGTVFVPAGTYMIDTTKAVALRSHVRLQLDPMAELKAKASSSTRYYMVKVWNANNVEVTGGKITGERTVHQGSTGEWGYALSVLGSSNVFVHDTRLSNAWGDGMFIGATGSSSTLTPSTDITINRVVSDNNRRQGLSIGPATRVFVYNSTFSNSNGTAPQSGIDVEPQSNGPASFIRIENTVISGNMGNGLNLCAYTSNVVVKRSTIRNNYQYGVFSTDATGTWLAVNLITQNGMDGVALTKANSNYKITSNTINYNSTRWFTSRGLPITTLTRSQRDLEVASTTTNLTLTNNTLSPTP